MARGKDVAIGVGACDVLSAMAMTDVFFNYRSFKIMEPNVSAKHWGWLTLRWPQGGTGQRLWECPRAGMRQKPRMTHVQSIDMIK